MPKISTAAFCTLASLLLTGITPGRMPSASAAPQTSGPRPASIQEIISSGGDGSPLLVDGADQDPVLAEKVKQARVLFQQGDRARSEGRRDAAMKLFQQALALTDEQYIHLALAQVDADSGKYAASVEHYRRGAYVRPAVPVGAVGAAGKGPTAHHADAVPESKSRVLVLKDPRDLMRFALVLSKEKQTEEAIAVYNEGVRWFNDIGHILPLRIVFDGKSMSGIYAPARLQAAAHTALAVLEGPRDVDKNKEMLGRLDEAIRLQPDLAIAHFYRGVAFRFTAVPGAVAEADASLSRAASLGTAEVKAAVKQVRGNRGN